MVPTLTFDLRTIFICTTLVAVLNCIALLACWRTQKTYAGFGWWVAATAAQVFAYLLLGLRGIIPPLLSIVVANGAAVLSAALRLDAVNRHLSKRSARYPLYVLCLAALFLLAFFTYWQDDALARIIVASAPMALLYWLSVWNLASQPGRPTSPPQRYIAVLLFLYGLALAARAAVWVVSPPDRSLLAPTATNVIFFMLALLLDVGLTLAFVMLNSQRLEVDLRQTHDEVRQGTAGLELRVQERTAELEQTNAELSRRGTILSDTAARLQGEIAERSRAEEAARRSEAKYRTLFESIDEGFCVIEVTFDERKRPLDYRFLEVNPAFERQTGIENAVGRWMREIAPQHEAHWFEIYGNIALTGEATRFENPADQLGRFYDVYAFRVGEPTDRHVAILFKDITTHKRTEDELRKASLYARSLIEASLDPLVTISPDGKITDVNRATETVTGVPRRRLIGTDFSNYFTEPGEARTGYEAVLAEGLVRDYSLTIRHCDGHMTDVLYNATLYRNEGGEPLGVFAAARDVTERKRAEQLLAARARQQAAVAELGQQALAGVDPDRLMGTACALVASTLGVEYAKVLEVLPDQDEMLLRAGVGWKEGLVGSATVPATDGSQAGYALQALQAQQPVIVEDLRTETRFKGTPLLHEHGVVSGISVLIAGPKRAFGVLGAHTVHRRSFTHDDIHFLQAIANVIATALQRQDAEDTLRATMRDLQTAHDGLQRAADELEERVQARTGELRAANEALSHREAALEAEIAERRAIQGALQASEERYRTLFSTMVEGFAIHEIICDEHGRPCDYRFLAANPAFEKLTGLRAEDILGRTVRQVLPGTESYWIETYGDVALHAKVVRFENYSRDLDRWYEVVAFSPVMGQFAVTFMDTTERKRAELDIHRLNEELRRHALDLEASNKELEAFAYSVSHDLRAPLRGIDGFARILEDEYSAQLDPGAARYLRLVRSNALQMGRLVDGLLAFSRLGRQALRKQPVQMAGLVRGALEDLAPEQEGRQVDIRIGDLPVCEGDPMLLKQVFVNLLSNALKFTRGKPCAVISVDCAVKNSEYVFSVQDNGAGFDMQYADKLFGVFQRLHSVSEFEGTGIGLANVQRIIHRHGGRIWAEAVEGSGATFYFTLGGNSDV